VLTYIGKLKGLCIVMVNVELTTESLIIYVNGIDKILALKSKVEVPLNHVSDVESLASYQTHDEHSNDIAWRLPGTGIPGVIKAGSYYQGAWSFWDVHNTDRAIVIHLSQEHYQMLVVEVDNPDLEIAKIKTALSSLPSLQ
jgi:hypothetical protein